MTDPWLEFESRARSAETAGYFERAGSTGRGPHAATWFDGAERAVVVGRDTTPVQLDRIVDRFLSRSPRGAVLGYLGFDSVGLFEPALRQFPRGSPFPLGELVFVAHVRRRTFRPAPVRPHRRRPPTRPLHDSLPRGRFERSVRRLVGEIRAGEAFQVVLSHRREWTRPDDLLRRARRLRSSERFAYFYYLKLGGREILGATPESVVEMRGRTAVVNPIAGTRPVAGATRRRPLAADPKELAEHRMLVDLARNDLGAVASVGSVRLLRREVRTRYARLEHLVSQVAADVPRTTGRFAVLAATFPAGTVSGAPKIRATQLLRREEASWRGPYAGAVGLLQGRRNADWALAIRTAFGVDDRLFTAAGAGIVHRSDPAREYAETLTKLAHVEATLVEGGR